MIPPNRKPVVIFEIADYEGQPLDLSDIDEGSMRFTVATLATEPSGESRYQNYILKKVTGKVIQRERLQAQHKSVLSPKISGADSVPMKERGNNGKRKSYAKFSGPRPRHGNP
jgi:hypothetical protein